MYQTWNTGIPFDRQTAARSFTFSTTFWSFACCGEPDSANAPPSMITSFCRSWMIRAQRAGIQLQLVVHVHASYLMYGSRRGPTSVRIEYSDDVDGM